MYYQSDEKLRKVQEEIDFLKKHSKPKRDSPVNDTNTKKPNRDNTPEIDINKPQAKDEPWAMKIIHYIFPNEDRLLPVLFKCSLIKTAQKIDREKFIQMHSLCTKTNCNENTWKTSFVKVQVLKAVGLPKRLSDSIGPRNQNEAFENWCELLF